MEFQHELIIPNEGLPFKLFLFEGRNGNYVREKHWHTSIEIFTVMEGSLSFYIGEVEYPLKAGEFLIINSNEVHSIQAPFRNETIVLQIPLKQFEDYFTAQRFIRFRRADAGRNEYGYGHERNHSGNIRLNFGTMGQTEAADPSETDRKMVSLIQELYRVYMSRETGYEFRTRAVFYEILYLMVSTYRETQVEESELKTSRRLDALSDLLPCSDIQMHICQECSGNMRRSILRHICRISAWHTLIRNFSIQIIRSVPLRLIMDLQAAGLFPRNL